MSIESWKTHTRFLKREVHAVYLACRDPRGPWYGRAMAVCVVGYALSPIDLIPDFIPVLGYLDDLILIPLGIALVLRTIPPQVMAECRAKAEAAEGKPKRKSWGAAAIIVALWIGLAALAIWTMIKLL